MDTVELLLRFDSDDGELAMEERTCTVVRSGSRRFMTEGDDDWSRGG